MGISASHYLAPYVYRRHRSGRHQLLTPTADPKTLKGVVLQGSAMGYPTKRDLCAAIVRSYWSLTSSMELDARRVPTQLRKALLRAAHVEIRRLERLERLAKRTRCPVALRRPGFRDALERALRSHRELAEGLKAVMKWTPCPENIRPTAPPTQEEVKARDIAAAWTWAKSLGFSWYVQREDAPIEGRTHSAVRRIVTPFGDTVKFRVIQANGAYYFTATVRQEHRNGRFDMLNGSMVDCFGVFVRLLPVEFTGIERVIVRDALKAL